MVQIRVRNGVPEISASQDLPDGLITVHGQRRDPADSSLSAYHRIQVEQRDTEGRYVQSAEHSGPVT